MWEKWIEYPMKNNWIFITNNGARVVTLYRNEKWVDASDTSKVFRQNGDTTIDQLVDVSFLKKEWCGELIKEGRIDFIG